MIERRFSGWKFVGIVLAVMILSGLVLILCLWRIAERRYARVQRSVQESVEPLLSGGQKRPVLQGTPLPGDANQDYLAAEAEVLAGSVYDTLRHGLERMSPRDLAAVNAAYPDLSRMVTLVRRGACRERVSFRNDRYTEAPVCVSTLMFLAVRRFVSAGQDKLAAEAILDALQYGRDVAETRQDVGRIVLILGLGELRTHLVAGRFDPESLRLLEHGLETLDGSFPSTDQEHLRWARTWALEARAPRSDGRLNEWLERGNYTTLCDLCLKAVGACKLDWLHERETLRSLDLELENSLNPRSRHSSIGLEGCGAYSRHLRAQLRLLRVGTHFLSTGLVIDLEDPFGGRLRSTLSGDALKVWSVGRDAVDDGGAGEWGFKGKDIVLELKRK